MNTKKKNRWYVSRVAASMVASMTFTGMALAAQDTPAPAVASDSTVGGQPLQAIFMDASGKVQWHAPAVDGKESAWKAAKVNDLIDPGSSIRTATNSRATLRVGKNATLLVDENTVVTLPAVTRDENTLRTVIQMARGRIDLKVDHVSVDKIGLDNDMRVATGSTTLAVRGTWFAVSAGALMGFEVLGARSNAIDAIELRYSLQNIRYFLSGNASSSTNLRDPVQRAWISTLGPPAIAGLLSSLSEQEQQASQGTTKADAATQTSQNARQMDEGDTSDRGTTTVALTEGQLDSYAARAVAAEQAAAGLRDVWVTGRSLAITYKNQAQEHALEAQSAVDAHLVAVDVAQTAALEALVQLGFAVEHRDGATLDYLSAKETLDGVLAKIEAFDSSAVSDTDLANALIDSSINKAGLAQDAANAAKSQKEIAEQANQASDAAIAKYVLELIKTLDAAANSGNSSAITQQASTLCAQFAALSTSFANRSTRDSAMAAAAHANALAVAAASSAVVALEAQSQALAAAQFASTYGEMILFTAAADAAYQAALAAGAAQQAANVAAAKAQLAADLRTQYAMIAASEAFADQIKAAEAAGLAVDFRDIAIEQQGLAADAKASVVLAVGHSQNAAAAAQAAFLSAQAQNSLAAGHLADTQSAVDAANAFIASGGDTDLLASAPVEVANAANSAAAAQGAANLAQGFANAAETAKNGANQGVIDADLAIGNFFAAVEAANEASTGAASQAAIATASAQLAAAYSTLATTLSNKAGTAQAMQAATDAFNSAIAAGQFAGQALTAAQAAEVAYQTANSMGDKVLFGAAMVAAQQAMQSFIAAVEEASLAANSAATALAMKNQVEQDLVDAQTEAAIDRMMSASNEADIAEANAVLANGFRDQAVIYANQATQAAQEHYAQVNAAQEYAGQALAALQVAVASRLAAESWSNVAGAAYQDTLAAINFKNMQLALQLVGTSQNAATNSQLAANEAMKASGDAANASLGATNASLLADQKATEFFAALNLSQSNAQGSASVAAAAGAAATAANNYKNASVLLANAAGTADALNAANKAKGLAEAAVVSAVNALAARDAAMWAADNAATMGQKVLFGAAAQFADAAAFSAAKAANEALLAQTAALSAANSAAAANNAYQVAANGSGSSGGSGGGTD